MYVTLQPADGGSCGETGRCGKSPAGGSQLLSHREFTDVGHCTSAAGTATCSGTLIVACRCLTSSAASGAALCAGVDSLAAAAFVTDNMRLFQCSRIDGSTLTQDVETISNWMKLQPPGCIRRPFRLGIPHSACQRVRQPRHAGPDDTQSDVLRALVSELRRLHPDREIRQVRCADICWHRLPQTLAPDGHPSVGLPSCTATRFT
jgi:hypothetical protein